MRLKARLISLILAAAALASLFTIESPVCAAPAVSAETEMRGVWIPTVLNLSYPSKTGLSVSALKAEADSRLDEALSMGMNTVFLQVRPTADAFYKSEIFPWSHYLTGTAGKDPGFDPLAYWIEAAHKRGLELHAWINPYRITHSTPKVEDVSGLPAGHPAKEHPSWVVTYENRLYFNPGIPEVRELVADGVAEIVENYKVDGIQFDDYFYPGKIDDAAAFETYGKDFENIDSWRRNNVDLLVKEVYERVKSINPSCVFGISPAGIWANSSTAFGSATKGNESFYSSYADTRKWVKLGWLDYIAPQIYWEIGHSSADYDTLARWWNEVCEGTGVKLYIGHAAYRVDPKSSTAAWRSPDELVKQLNLNKALKNVKGSIFFQLATMTANPSVVSTLRDYYASQTKSGQVLSYPLAINSPAKDITENVTSYYIMGSSDPSLPLYINGEEITDRSASGFFGKLISLEKGANLITARQGSKIAARTITRAAVTSPSTPAYIDKAGIVTDSVRPQTNQYLNPGQVYKLGCTAPIGASVSAVLGGKTYKLTPATTTKPAGSKIYTTTFSYDFTAPALSGAGKISTIGTPVYKMTYGGKTVSATTPGIIKNITAKAPVYAQIASPTAWTYSSNSSSGGNTGDLTQGMEDYVVCTSGNWIKLGMGVWVYDENVKITETAEPKLAVLSKFSYSQYAKWDYIQVSASAKTSSSVSLSGNALSYTVYNSTLKAGMAPSLPPDSPFESVGATESGGNVTFTLRVKTGTRIDGWYVRMLANGAQELAVKKRPAISKMTIGKPLTGIKILLDPGHGGSAPGALGPLGAALPEKTLVFTVCQKTRQKLEALGAQVVMTRTSDKYMELEERLEISRAERPDLFLSIHLNSTPVTTDSTKVRGVLSLYREPNAKDFASLLHEDIAATLFREPRGAKTQNLYVCRGYWTPSVLLECAFINNPQEFEWVLSPDGSDALAASITRSVVQYFS